MNWFWKLIHRLIYRNYTPENLALGAEKADKLRKEIKCNAHLILRSINPQMFKSYLSQYIIKSDILVDTGEVQWWLLLHEKEEKLELRCVRPACYEKKRAASLLFSSTEQAEIPLEHLISMHQALKRAIGQVIYRYGGAGLHLRPFVQIAKHKS